MDLSQQGQYRRNYYTILIFLLSGVLPSIAYLLSPLGKDENANKNAVAIWSITGFLTSGLSHWKMNQRAEEAETARLLEYDALHGDLEDRGTLAESISENSQLAP